MRRSTLQATPLPEGNPAAPSSWNSLPHIGDNMDNKLVTTSLTLPGYEIARSLGIVRGITVRSRSVVGNFIGGLQTLFGGNISVYTNLCEQARSEAYDLMCQHARQHGANAIISVRYDATELMAGLTEVLCYGTAVVVEPKAVGSGVMAASAAII